MSRFFPYIYEGPPLRELTPEDLRLAAGHLGHTANFLGDQFGGNFEHEKPADADAVVLRLHHSARNTLLLLQARMTLGRVAKPSLFLAGVGDGGVEELHRYSLARQGVELVRDQLLAEEGVGNYCVNTTVTVGPDEASSFSAEIIRDSQIAGTYQPITAGQAQHLMWPGGAVPEQQVWQA